MDRLALFRFYHEMILKHSVRGFFDLGHWAETEQTVDELYKRMFAVRMRLNEDGSSTPYVEDKKDMDNERLSRFIDQCIHFMAEELGIDINEKRGKKADREQPVRNGSVHLVRHHGGPDDPPHPSEREGRERLLREPGSALP